MNGMQESSVSFQSPHEKSVANQPMEPMTVGRIVDRSLRLTPKLFKSLMVIALVVATLDGIDFFVEMAFSENATLVIASKVLSIGNRYLSAVLYILMMLFSAKLWVGETPTIANCKEQIRFGRILKGVFLSFYVSLLSFFGAILFIIPGVIFFLNRALAHPVFYLEGQNFSGALERSKFLMKQVPWYKGSSPVARLSLLFGIQIFTTGVAAMAIVLTPFWMKAGGLGVTIQAISALLGGLVLQFLTMFATLSIVGFYLDLKVRYEGEDLLKSLEGN